jgi:transcriptional regulator with XRE-family HTH domain
MTENPVEAKAFGARIRELREARRWTQGQLLDLLVISGAPLSSSATAAISRIESGQRNVTLFEAITLAELFDVTLDELVGVTCDERWLTARQTIRRMSAELQVLDQEVGLALRQAKSARPRPGTDERRQADLVAQAARARTAITGAQVALKSALREVNTIITPKVDHGKA